MLVLVLSALDLVLVEGADTDLASYTPNHVAHHQANRQSTSFTSFEKIIPTILDISHNIHILELLGERQSVSANVEMRANLRARL